MRFTAFVTGEGDTQRLETILPRNAGGSGLTNAGKEFLEHGAVRIGAPILPGQTLRVGIRVNVQMLSEGIDLERPLFADNLEFEMAPTRIGLEPRP